jgi:hypothetical protein
VVAVAILTGVQPAYQIAHPGEKDHTNVDRAAWISAFEEALAKTIVRIVLSRQAEQTSQSGRHRKRIASQPQAAFLACALGRESGYQRAEGILRWGCVESAAPIDVNKN